MTHGLLQRVAKCAPEWMGAEFATTAISQQKIVRFNPKPNQVEILYAEEPRPLDNARTLCLMREAISREGTPWSLSCYWGPNQSWVCDMRVDVGHFNGYPEDEAIVNAFLKVFEKEEA